MMILAAAGEMRADFFLWWNERRGAECALPQIQIIFLGGHLIQYVDLHFSS
jgi:hypothetical protein